MHSSPSQPLAGRIALVTGASTGIGRVTARQLALQGAHVYLACRSEARTRPVIEEIQRLTGRAAAEWLELDLADTRSIRACAARILSTGQPLHLLINNAGLAGARGLTRDGFEMAFGVNHLGHFLLTDLLLERLKASAPARIVTVASRAHRRAPAVIDWNAVQKPTRSLTGVREYAVSKLANVLFSAELARRLGGSGISTYALHPGVVDTEVWRAVPRPLRPLLKLRGLLTPEEGALTTLHCAVYAPASESGLYYAQSAVTTPADRARDFRLAAELWRRSEEWVADIGRHG
ncbi:MAG: SDR family oxidoreductase [Rhodocyclaceae bacterium]|nr:MAG: SDR family oxidoreductase [Rhodocyclaceae bacterium]